ncbi:hypothetical protein D320_00309 [Haloferax sp. BAB-2207]|nr:hypothetical protein D320_00309 [Haloferax sp. BAB-2207]
MLGISAESDATTKADPEDLFGMSTAYLTMEADLRFDSADEAALCFSSVDSTDFADTVDAVEDILTAGSEETGTEFSRHTDGHGYNWVVLADDDPEDLVTSVHFAADEFIERGYGSRLLAALFGFERDGDRAYWIYSFRRGAYYPFAPQHLLAEPESGVQTRIRPRRRTRNRGRRELLVPAVAVDAERPSVGLTALARRA